MRQMNRQVMTKSLENKKRLAMLKRVNYYEYLINYGGTNQLCNSTKTIECEKQTSTLFFPDIQISSYQNESAMCSSSRTSTTLNVERDEQKTNQTKVAQIRSLRHKTKRRSTTESKRAFQKKIALNIEQLTVTSIQPKARSNKTTSFSHISKDIIDITSRSSHYENTKPMMRLSPKKQQYFQQSWLFRNKLRPSTLNTTRLRNKSISPWDIDFSPY